MNAKEKEVDFNQKKLIDQARGLKFGSFIADIEESLLAGDWKQVAEDVAALRRYWDSVCAARRELNL